MRNNTSTIEIPTTEYNILKEIYRNYKRQKFLFRIDEVENNMKSGKIKKTKIDDFINNIK